MRYAGVLVLGLAACGGDDAPAGVDADPADLDGDGVLNEVDVCPRYPDPLQHDEDADGLGDACDNCPGTPNPAQLDTGEEEAEPPQFADHIGDACDPRPAWSGDERVFFFPFVDARDAQSWTIASGDWRFGGDQLQLVAGASEDVLVASDDAEREATGDGLMVRAMIRIDAVTPGDVALAIGVSGHRCTLAGIDSASQLDLVAETGETASTPLAIPVTTGSTIELWLHRQVDAQRRTNLRCRVLQGGTTMTSSELVTLDDSAAPIWELRMNGASVTMPWIEVFTAPFACTLVAPGVLPACPR